MEYRNLGRSGLRVSVLTMGTMTFGGGERAALGVGADMRSLECRERAFARDGASPMIGVSDKHPERTLTQQLQRSRT